MNRFLYLFGLILLVAPSGYAALDRDVRVISSTGQSVVLEYTPHYFEPATIVEGNTVFQYWSFEGAIERGDGSPGNLPLYHRSLPLILPGPSGNSIEVLSVEYETVTDVLLQPVPRVKGDFEDLRKTYPLGAAYQSNKLVPSSVAEFLHTGTVRGYETGEIQVSPLQYNPASRTLLKHTRILVRVNFGPASHRIVSRPEDPLMKDFALNYSTAKNWRVEAPASMVQYRSSVFSSGTWFRFAITESGMYELTGATLLAAGLPAGTNPRTIKIYGNGGIEPPDHPAAPYPDDVLELAVYVYDGGTVDALDASDYLVFYGQGPSGWTYNPGPRTFQHWINLYSNVAYYWLTYGGNQSKLMATAASLPDPSPYSPATVIGKVFREDERVNVQNSGRQWLGQSLTPNDAVTYLFPLAGIDISRPVNYRIAVGSRNTFSQTQFVITEHGITIANPIIQATSGDEVGQYYTPYVRMSDVSTSALLPEAQSQLRFNYVSPTPGTGYIDWIELLYDRQLTADGNVFNFHGHDTTAVTSYTVGGFTQSPVWTFDVSRFDSVVRIDNAGQPNFQVMLTQGALREFCMVGDGAFKTPGTLQAFANQDVHGDTLDVDLIIITHGEFLPAAQRLRDHRQSQGLAVRIVDVEEIYNEFSNGYLSPVGIRNYLRYLNIAYAAMGTVKYVLLFGDGDFDFRRMSTPGPNWVPVWATSESFAIRPLDSYATDDSLSIMPGSPRVQVAMGRLPVRSLSQANDVVNKIIEYETTVTPDPWKLRVTFVADDGFQEGTTYAGQSEALASEPYTSTLFEVQKIYSAEYPLVSTPVGRRRPTVNQAIVDAINRGTLVLNFIGHGNPRLWTHEQVFVRETDFPRLTNAGKYFLVIAATCNYSQYDHPSDQSSGEQLVVKPAAGAIASVSASRPVFGSENYSLVRTFYLNMFQPDSLGRVGHPRLGDIFFRTKQVHFAGTADNDKKFVLLGDPSVRLAIPRRTVVVDTLNGLPDSLTALFRALDTASVVASVRDSVSNQPASFSGTSLVTVYDADRRVTINKPNEFFVMTYTAPGGVLFRGQASIVDGRLASSFIVPIDIAYDTTKPAKISLFFSNAGNTEDGAGVTRNLRVGGTNPNAPPDSTGPRISLFLDNRNFAPGALVSDNPLLIADLYDEHGINSSNIGIGHRLEAWVDDQPESIDLSDHYRSELDNYQEGTIEYVLTGLAHGSHRLRLRAWDTYNNSSLAETNFDVGVSIGLRVYNVVNYPNPFRNMTTFTFQHNQLVPVDVEVKIYTVAGRLLESLEQRSVPDLFVRVPWSGRDRDGDEIANGIYLYKIIVRTQDGRFSSETLGKLSKLR